MNHQYLNAAHDDKVYQQGLSTRLSAGRGAFLDMDMRQLWYDNSLGKALTASLVLGDKYNVFVHQPSLW